MHIREITIMLYFPFFTLTNIYFCVSKQPIAFIKVGSEENGEPSEGLIGAEGGEVRLG